MLTRGQLIDRVWGADYVGDTKTLDVHVKRLRAKDRNRPGEPGAAGDGAWLGLQAGGLNWPMGQSGDRGHVQLEITDVDEAPAEKVGVGQRRTGDLQRQ